MFSKQFPLMTQGEKQPCAAGLNRLTNLPLKQRISGRNAIVTGAGSGVGAAIAIALSMLGAQICLVGRRIERLQAIATAAQHFDVRARWYPADFADDKTTTKLASRLASEIEGVDILVHSAAVIERASVDQASIEDFDRHYRVNVRAPYVLTQALLPQLRSRKGDIVFINSSSGIAAKPQFAQYDATKHALKAVADSLRAEVNGQDIRVLSVYLGRTATEMQAKLHEAGGELYAPHLLLQPEDIASAVLNMLALPRSAEVTDLHIRPMIKS